jgi:hypothetical protein
LKSIKFIPFGGKQILTEPSVSKIPQWWKDGESEINHSGHSQPGLKSCIPFMEIMMSGYVINAPFDIYIDASNKDKIQISWNGPQEGDWPSFIQERPKDLGYTIPRPAGHLENHFVWYSQWSWQVPKGYSVLVTHPFNRFDLPFTTLSGIIDSDTFHGNGKIPFFIKEGFTGVIKEGTPIMQIMPFKREKWKHLIDGSGIKDIYRSQVMKLSKPGSSYKKLFWSKKQY